MGEIAEMMLDGTMCAGCGEWLNDGEDGDGFPGYCASCAPDYEDGIARTKCGQLRPSKTNCPHCDKLVKKVGLEQHIKHKHPANHKDCEAV